jgi:beta-N-acetylhexosaminidase
VKPVSGLLRRLSFGLRTALAAGLALLAVPTGLAQANRDVAMSPTDCAERAQLIVADMSLRERVGQLLMGTPAAGTLPDEATRLQIQDYGIGSFITQNSVPRTPDGAAKFHNQMQAWAEATRLGIPVFAGMDLENGTAQQVPAATGHPYPMGLGATFDPILTAQAAAVAGTEAAAFGVNWSFGPVSDLNTNPANPVIGVRSFGAYDPSVSAHAAAYAEALQGTGVLPSAKHFPGHGDTSVDSHTGLPTVTYDRSELNRHLAPFQAAFDVGAKGVMTAHVVIEAVDPDLPATLSPRVLTGLLRGEMGFDGVVVTDSMNMAAITNTYGRDEALVMAIGAGADIGMVAGDARHSSDVLMAAVDSGQLPLERVSESSRRVVRTKCEMGLWEHRYADPTLALSTVGTPQAHVQAVEQAAASMTLLADNGVLPIDRSAQVLVAGQDAQRVSSQLQSLGATGVTSVGTTQSPTAAERALVATLARTQDVVVITTFTSAAPNSAQEMLVGDVAATGTPTVAVSLGLPYDLANLTTADARLAAFALNVNRVGSPEVFTGLAAVLLGDRPAAGRLPVPVGVYPIGHGIGGGPTAVQVSTIAAARKVKGIFVRWRTASETRAAGFNLYREQRGRLAKLNRTLIHSAFGGTATGRVYSWLDRSAPRGKLTYRLELVDFQGVRSWIASATVG